jgi:helix-turn-helix protein
MSEDGEIARAVGVSRPAAIGWRSRYEQGGIRALAEPTGPDAIAVRCRAPLPHQHLVARG